MQQSIRISQHRRIAIVFADIIMIGHDIDICDVSSLCLDIIDNSSDIFVITRSRSDKSEKKHFVWMNKSFSMSLGLIWLDHDMTMRSLVSYTRSFFPFSIIKNIDRLIFHKSDIEPSTVMFLCITKLDVLIQERTITGVRDFFFLFHFVVETFPERYLCMVSIFKAWLAIGERCLVRCLDSQCQLWRDMSDVIDALRAIVLSQSQSMMSSIP